jgi:hypothetical protein
MWSSIKWSIRIWLAVALAAVALAAWEIGGVEPNVPWHTLSFLSRIHSWLAITIGAIVALAAGGFEVWWWGFHMRSKIEK